MRIARIVAVSALAVASIVASSVASSAATASTRVPRTPSVGLLYSIDARSTASVNPSNLWSILDLAKHYSTTNGGAVTFDATAKTLVFDSSDMSYLDISRGFTDFRQGITIEARANFGESVDDWERIVDIGGGRELDNIAISRGWDTGKIVFEIWGDGYRYGRAETVNSVANSNKLLSVAATLGPDLVPHIFVNGSEQRVIVTFAGDPGKFSAMPRVVTRNHNYIGHSNWWEDPNLEGSVQYLRIYNTVISKKQIKADAKYDKAYRATTTTR